MKRKGIGYRRFSLLSPHLGLTRLRPAYWFALCALAFAIKTYCDVSSPHLKLQSWLSGTQVLAIADRHGRLLSISHQNPLSNCDRIPLYEIPPLLQIAFIASEDQRFYQHGGIDWQARIAALWQNIRATRIVRGASTITEQVVRMLHPRPRTWWSKWIETFEATSLERHSSKANILEFYLNQVPYASNRRGVMQASHYYFDRDLSTLNVKETLALAILIRAPSRLDLYGNLKAVERETYHLAELLVRKGTFDQRQLEEVRQQTIALQRSGNITNAAHFVGFVRRSTKDPGFGWRYMITTLDLDIQRQVQEILDERTRTLHMRDLRNAGALVVDHSRGEILAWVVAGTNNSTTPGGQIDAVTSPRQPGSALKPFLYAAALELGWSSATVLDDSPLVAAVGSGLHNFKNYSNTYYGKISLREALANSLNIPALRTIEYVGTSRYLSLLHKLGFASLNREASVYDRGLALGNGEVTLLELTQAYAVLANRGIYRPLKFSFSDNGRDRPKRLISDQVASLVGNILSDPWARRLEFGSNSILNLPVQTAVKTGTSTDYRDAWAVGFNDTYVVGIWMGNLDGSPTDGVTGSTGPALAIRSIFSRLNQHRISRPLYLSQRLVRQDICVASGDDTQCAIRSEYFVPGTEPTTAAVLEPSEAPTLVTPTSNLQLAWDPRIPRERHKFEFQIEGLKPGESVSWMLNDRPLAHTDSGKYLWNVDRGQFRLAATVYHDEDKLFSLPEVAFSVK
ncbi:MAG: transglycosylase domain-containing protein [Deltaproteobacteria bacterium]|nr:transglycosylase domain-containing protein [Deltaproteobacteria bacterium]